LNYVIKTNNQTLSIKWYSTLWLCTWHRDLHLYSWDLTIHLPAICSYPNPGWWPVCCFPTKSKGFIRFEQVSSIKIRL